MAMTNNERQAAYRQAHRLDLRINMNIDSGNGWKIDALARHYGVTKKKIMEQAVDALLHNTKQGMTEKEQDVFHGV